MNIATKSRRAHYRKLLVKYRLLYLMMIPGLAYFIVFRYMPIYGITLAFKEFRIVDGIAGSPWVGLKYFERLFIGRSFGQVVRNTLLLNMYRLLFGFPAPVILALIINELKNSHYQKIVQTVTYMPHFISWVVVYGLFAQLLSPSTGPINIVIRKLGGTPIYFLGDTRWFRTTIVASDIWKSVGWSSIIYLAALTGIDTQLYEAARIDGATRLQRIWHITLPCIKPTIVIMLILRAGDLMEDNFEQVFNFLNDNTLSVGDIISTYVYRIGITKMQYSTGTAVDLFTSVISLGLVLSANFIAKKVGEQGIW